MQDKSTDERQRNSDTPHADDQAVHIEQGVTTTIQHAVDRDSIDAAADHIEGHDHHHSRKVTPGLICQNDHPNDKWGYGKHKGG